MAYEPLVGTEQIEPVFVGAHPVAAFAVHIDTGHTVAADHVLVTQFGTHIPKHRAGGGLHEEAFLE
jgi:hypothetical protein